MRIICEFCHRYIEDEKKGFTLIEKLAAIKQYLLLISYREMIPGPILQLSPVEYQPKFLNIRPF